MPTKKQAERYAQAFAGQPTAGQCLAGIAFEMLNQHELAKVLHGGCIIQSSQNLTYCTDACNLAAELFDACDLVPPTNPMHVSDQQLHAFLAILNPLID